VPHDSNDNVGYLIEHQNQSICLITDAGEITNEIEKYIQRTTQLILESNYDDKMLDDGPYPEILKRRIRSGSGHLCNIKAAETIYKYRKQLEKVWLCHLSENNNTPEKAFEMVLNVFQGNGLKMSDFINLQVLMRKTPSTVFHL
jgi:phosphoribosyl 1,2-cyclic phosphodiesterase